MILKSTDGMTFDDTLVKDAIYSTCWGSLGVAFWRDGSTRLATIADEALIYSGLTRDRVWYALEGKGRRD